MPAHDHDLTPIAPRGAPLGAGRRSPVAPNPGLRVLGSRVLGPVVLGAMLTVLAAAGGPAAAEVILPVPSSEGRTQSASLPPAPTIILDRLDRLERQIERLGNEAAGPGNERRGDVGAVVPGRPVQLAQGGPLPQSYAAQVEVRLSNLEQRLQALTGQIEQLQFRASQAEGRLERALNDIEYRLSTVEGGGDLSGAPPAGGNRPGPSPAGGTLGTLPGGSGAGAGPQTAMLPPGDPVTQYDFAYGLLQRGDYDGAERALREFADRNASHSLASNALYWLGETYYVRGRFGDAAAAFGQGFQRFPDGSKAVDSLLKLGMSLAQMGQRDDACLTLAQLGSQFPDAPAAVQRRAAAERQRLGCR